MTFYNVFTIQLKFSSKYYRNRANRAPPFYQDIGAVAWRYILILPGFFVQKDLFYLKNGKTLKLLSRVALYWRGCGNSQKLMIKNHFI